MKQIIMSKNLLYTIYSAGFNHGCNEGSSPEHGTFDAFNRLLIGESPMEDGVSYDIKEKVEELISIDRIEEVLSKYWYETEYSLIDKNDHEKAESSRKAFRKWIGNNLIR